MVAIRKSYWLTRTGVGSSPVVRGFGLPRAPAPPRALPTAYGESQAASLPPRPREARPGAVPSVPAPLASRAAQHLAMLGIRAPVPLPPYPQTHACAQSCRAIRPPSADHAASVRQEPLAPGVRG